MNDSLPITLEGPEPASFAERAVVEAHAALQEFGKAPAVLPLGEQLRMQNRCLVAAHRLEIAASGVLA